MRRHEPEILGEFEQLVLLAVLRLGDEAYAVPIRREIERRTGRPVSRGAVYVTLSRLSDKSYLESRMGEPTAERGGRAKRLYRVRPSGVLALKSCLAALDRMRAGLPAGLEV
jgi:DNA-binding PadR family transcriptional regulator